MEGPILFLLFDMGVERTERTISPAFQVSCSFRKDPEVWAIHSRGNDETVFGCLKLMKCIGESGMFFASTVSDGSLHDELAEGNKIFGKLDESFRYSRPAEMEEEDVEETRDSTEDTPMVDV